MATSDTQVLVVGAGPTGLTLACDLRRRGIDCRVVDRAVELHRRSRGKGVQPRTVEVFDDLGIAAEVLAAGRRTHRLRLYAAGRLVVDLTVRARPPRPGVPHPDLVVIPQWRTEEILRNRLVSLGGVVEAGRELVSLEQDDEGVTAGVADRRTGGRPEPVRADYVIGCDGGHSAVRQLIGLPLRGRSEHQHFVLGDVRIDGLQPGVAVAWFHGREYLAADPLDGAGTWQVQASVAPDAGGRLEPASVELFQRLFTERGFPDVRLHHETWLSDYSPRVAMVERYRDRRVLLAGDAAHVHSPAGGQGLNTGVQDAYNLGWKLGLVLAGTASDALLDTYQEERLPVARSVLEGSGRGHTVVFSPHPVVRLLRERVLAPLLRLDAVQRAILDRSAELTVGYRGSSLSREQRDGVRLHPIPGGSPVALTARLRFRRGPHAGDRAPDARCRAGEGGPARLFDRFRGPHATVLVFSGRGPASRGSERLSALARAVGERFPGEIRVWIVVPGDRVPAGLDPRTVLLDPAGEASDLYGVAAEALYLVRPDGYIGHRSQPVDEPGLLTYLATLFPGRSSSPASL